MWHGMSNEALEVVSEMRASEENVTCLLMPAGCSSHVLAQAD